MWQKERTFRNTHCTYTYTKTHTHTLSQKVRNPGGNYLCYFGGMAFTGSCLAAGFYSVLFAVSLWKQFYAPLGGAIHKLGKQLNSVTKCNQCCPAVGNTFSKMYESRVVKAIGLSFLFLFFCFLFFDFWLIFFFYVCCFAVLWHIAVCCHFICLCTIFFLCLHWDNVNIDDTYHQKKKTVFFLDWLQY